MSFPFGNSQGSAGGASGGAAGGGGGVTTFTSFATFPAVASDGDYAQHVASGKMYRYSSDWGGWVDPLVYDGTPALLASIVGDDATPAGWTVEGGGGTLTTDGTWLSIETLANANLERLYHVHNLTRGTRLYYMKGFCKVTVGTHSASLAHPSMAIGVGDDARSPTISLERSTTLRNPYLAGDSNADIGQSAANAIGGSGSFFELLWSTAAAGVQTKTLQFWVDGVLQVVYAGTGGTPLANGHVSVNKSFFFGDRSGSDFGEMEIKLVECGTA